MTRRPLVIVFARAPRLGRVKTRLARGAGASAALRFHRLTLAAIVRRLARSGRWETRIATTPDRDAGRGRGWSRGIALAKQGDGDLGTRMLRAIAAAGRRPVAIVGSDVPALDAAAITRALALLAANEVVLGPSGDGGYWLLGWRGPRPSLRLLAGVRWSTPHALADTRARLGRRRLALADRLDDVDDAAGYARWLRPSPSA